MKSWHLICMLAVTHYGAEFFHARWHVFTAGMGATCLYLLHHVKAPEGSMLWLVCAWGQYESLQVFVCQGMGAVTMAQTRPFEGMCDVQTGVPFFTSGLIFNLVLATLWLVRSSSERSRPPPAR